MRLLVRFKHIVQRFVLRQYANHLWRKQRKEWEKEHPKEHICYDSDRRILLYVRDYSVYMDELTEARKKAYFRELSSSSIREVIYPKGSPWERKTLN